MSVPDLSARLSPGESAAGFSLGEAFPAIVEKVGPVVWHESNAQLESLLEENVGWAASKFKVGFSGDFVVSLHYKNDLVRLDFWRGEALYQIKVGIGYESDFLGVKVGDDLLELEERFSIGFEGAEDAFYVTRDGTAVDGIAFVTDYRASLEHAPHQVIKGIVVYDYTLTKQS